jgi:hypothetical protein
MDDPQGCEKRNRERMRQWNTLEQSHERCRQSKQKGTDTHTDVPEDCRPQIGRLAVRRIGKHTDPMPRWQLPNGNI